MPDVELHTIEDIVREMRKKADQADFVCCGNVDASFVRIFANRIEAAAANAAKRGKRKRKYEYALKWGDGVIECKSDSIKRTKERENGLNRGLVEHCVIIVRREVGEWEELARGR